MLRVMPTTSTWRGSSVTIHNGNLSEVTRHVPSFERRPFAIASPDSGGARDNRRLDSIVRLPIDDDTHCIPVGVVSKDYALLPHATVVDAVVKALEEARIDPAGVEAELRLTELGERMALSLRLPDSYLFDPGDRYPMTVRLECLNSVDGSTKFRAVMGWFRLVCSNGLAIGVTRSESDRRHVGDLQLEHIGAVLRAGMNEYKLERDTLLRWRDMEVGVERLREWVDCDLKARWGFKAAARAFHIARSGCDVEIVGPYKRHTPTTIPVETADAVPGSPPESTSLFDLSQILAWLAKERRDIQEQMDWREQIPALIAPLAART